jgi:methyl-accepting chemotaxis protein
MFDVFHAKDQAVLKALNASQAIIEFTPDGRILTANDNFLTVMGYQLREIVGQHHRLFCDPDYIASDAYAAFWRDLGRGAFRSDEFKRFRKDGVAVWLQATYNPVLNHAGQVERIVKFASDITKAKQISLDDGGKITAIYKSQAVIEFTPDGDILSANDNFLKTVGYSLDEIVGRSHRMFCAPDYVASPDYARLWSEVRAGRFVQSEFRRLGKNGREIYIQAAYNPIFDDDGKVVKIVKFAVDMTELVAKRLRNDGIARSVDDELGGVLAKIRNADRMAGSASGASGETAGIVNSVAAAAEELSHSVREIAHNMTEARDSVHSILGYAAEAGDASRSLNETAAAMTSIVNLIQSIASQINLLALNATIESARAGEAGKGFAVVASEVKSLATQAATATRTISDEIGHMQAVSERVDATIGLIGNHVQGVMERVSGVAAAVDQQTAVTAEISGNMQTAVRAVGEIAESLTHISHTFADVSQAATQVKQNVETLAA